MSDSKKRLAEKGINVEKVYCGHNIGDSLEKMIQCLFPTFDRVTQPGGAFEKYAGKELMIIVPPKTYQVATNFLQEA